MTTTHVPNDSNAYIQVGGCEWCNGNHTGLCPLVLEIEYRDDDSIKRLVFIPPDQRPTPCNVEITVSPLEGNGHECGKDCAVNTAGQYHA